MTDEEKLPPELEEIAAELSELGVECRGKGLLEKVELPNLSATDFEPLYELGRGGMGIVYAARQISLGRTIALKMLSPHLSKDATFRARFLDEAHLIAQLHHPNIVEVYSAFTQNDTCYFAMEWIEGTSAREHEFLNVAEIARFGVRVAEALAYAHECGVLHRDIKPANILIGKDGTIKVGDFGLACLLGSAADSSGTQGFMAPEICRGEAPTKQSDVFQLGRTLEREAASHLKLHPDADFAAILAKATAADLNVRYADMNALAQDLRHYLAHEPLAARPPSTIRRLALWSRRNPPAAVLFIASIFLALGLFIALAVGYAHSCAALRAVEQEASHTANALADALTATEEDRLSPNKRLSKLNRAKETLEQLKTRFPENEEVAAALLRIEKATEFSKKNPPRRPKRER